MGKNYVDLEEIKATAARIKPYVRRTPLLREDGMDDVLGCEVYLKPEMLQISGAFKMRGATNKVMGLSEEEREKGIICISEGNHARACATAGHLFGVKTTVVVPEDTPKAKLDGVKRMKGNIVLGPRGGRSRWEMRDRLVEEEGYIDVHPTDDYEIIAGTGTIGLEILEDLPEVNTLIVPVGGGGLISGIAIAAKSIDPNVKVVGVQARANECYVQSFHAGKPLYIETKESIADGLNCEMPEDICFPLVCKYVDEMVSVEEESIRQALRLIMSEAKVMPEPSSCVGVAAVLEGVYQPKEGEKVCFVLSAGNWEIEKIGKILAGEA